MSSYVHLPVTVTANTVLMEDAIYGALLVCGYLQDRQREESLVSNVINSKCDETSDLTFL